MKKSNLFFFGMIILIFSMINVLAVPPVTTVTQFPEGYLITEAQQDYIPIGKGYLYHFIVNNVSNGAEILNDSINC